MQINGNQLPIAYFPKPVEPQDYLRTPVVIDVQPFKQAISDQQPNQRSGFDPQTTLFKDAQQAGFVRVKAFASEPASYTALPKTPLPKPVQQYLETANLTFETQRLFDETV